MYDNREDMVVIEVEWPLSVSFLPLCCWMTRATHRDGKRTGNSAPSAKYETNTITTGTQGVMVTMTLID
jgi:hypothetical protein